MTNKFIRKCTIIYKKTLLKLLSFGKVREMVLFESFKGRSYSDNPRAISEKLHSLEPDIKIVWALYDKDKNQIVPPYVTIVNKKSVLFYRLLSTCACFVTNEALESYYIKRKGEQLFIQTWHGDRAFKKVLYDAWKKKQRPEPIMDELLTDFCVAGSEYGEKQFRSAFHYKGEVLISGTPRDDCLVNIDDNRIDSIRRFLNLDAEKHYVLYAPTIRQKRSPIDLNKPIQNIDIQKTLKAYESTYGGEWRCLLRAHPKNTGFLGIESNNYIIDVSAYPDMADLLLVSDSLITDYSSCAGDYALLEKPLFLFQEDITEYTENERDLYFDIKDSPYFVAHSQEELCELICSTTEKAIKINCHDILNFYITHETGIASTTVAKRIVEFINKVVVQ